MTDNNDIGTIKDIHRKWIASSRRETLLTERDVLRLIKRNSLIDRLRRRALMLFFLGLSGPFLILGMKQHIPISNLLCIVYSSFMLICAITNIYWWYRIGQVSHYMTAPMITAQKQISKLNTLRFRIKIMGWILGAPVIFLLFYEIAQSGEDNSLLGAAFGGVIGLIIGLTWEYLNRKQIKKLKESFDLQDTDSDQYYI